MREVTKIFTAICVKLEFFKNQKEEDIESEKFLLYMGQYFKLSLDKMDDMSLAHLLAVLKSTCFWSFKSHLFPRDIITAWIEILA